ANNTTTIHITDTLPAGLINITAPSNGAVYDSDSRTITYIGSAEPRQRLTFTYQATVDKGLAEGSILYNKVEATGLELHVETGATVVVPNKNDSRKTLLLVNIAGDNDLSDEVFKALSRAEEVVDTSNVIIRVLVDGFRNDNTYVLTLNHNSDPECPSASDFSCYELEKNRWSWTDNTAQPVSLRHFIQTNIQAYPNAKQILLSMVGHGTGWSPSNTPPMNVMGRSDFIVQPSIVGAQSAGFLLDTHPYTSTLSTAELGQVFASVYEETKRKIDLVYFDACSMGMFEVAYEIAPYADYVLLSENLAWATFPYDKHIQDIEPDKTAQEIGLDWLENEVESLKDGRYPFTLSLVETSKLSRVHDTLNTVASKLIEEIRHAEDNRDKIRRAFDRAKRFDSNYDLAIDKRDFYGDLSSFMIELEEVFPSLKESIAPVREAVASAVIKEVHVNGSPWMSPTVVWDWGDTLSGLALYVPFNLDHDEWKRKHYQPLHLRSAATGTWDDLITAYWDDKDAHAYTRTRERSEMLLCPQECAGIGAPLPLRPTIMVEQGIQASYRQTVTVPIELMTFRHELSVGNFALEFDENCLSLSGEIAFADGLSGDIDLSGTNQITFANVQDASMLNQGVLATVEFTAICQPADTSITTPINITSAAFMDSKDIAVEGISTDGSVIIGDRALGDINGDGMVNIFDLQMLINMIMHHTPGDPNLYPSDWWEQADLNGDGVWNIFDLQLIINLI
ncbi:MAG: clostripain-related cysteine peptidase, partial [Chloroflexota bacterium]